MSVPFGLMDEEERDLPLGGQELAPEEAAKKAAQEIFDKEAPGKYYTPLMRIYGIIGMVLMRFDKTCGSAVLLQAEDTARAVDRLAKENPAVRRVIEAIIAKSVYGELIAAHAPILATVFAHHIPQTFRENFGEYLFHGMTGDQSENGERPAA